MKYHIGGRGKLIALAVHNQSHIPKSLLTARYDVPVKLGISGRPGETDKCLSQEFSVTLQFVPGRYHVDSFESTSVSFLLKMSPLTYPRLSASLYLEWIGLVEKSVLNKKTSPKRMPPQDVYWLKKAIFSRGI